MLFSFKNTLMYTSKYGWSNIWVLYGPVKLTHKINYYRWVIFLPTPIISVFYLGCVNHLHWLWFYVWVQVTFFFFFNVCSFFFILSVTSPFLSLWTIRSLAPHLVFHFNIFIVFRLYIFYEIFSRCSRDYNTHFWLLTVYLELTFYYSKWNVENLLAQMSLYLPFLILHWFIYYIYIH